MSSSALDLILVPMTALTTPLESATAPLVIAFIIGIALGAAIVGWRSSQAVSNAKIGQAQLLAELATAQASLTALEQTASTSDAASAEMIERFKLISQEVLENQQTRADQVSDHRLHQTAQLLTPMSQLLERLDQRLGEVERDRVKWQTQLSSEVKNVTASTAALGAQTQALAHALTKPQVRGAWGETQLTRIIEAAGMVEHCDFSTQESTSTADKRQRPDLTVFLEGGRRIYVDSKVPLEAFLDAQAAATETERTADMKRFIKHVTTHIDQLASKEYWSISDSSPEFTVLFVPSDAFLIDALQVSATLVEYAAERRIVLASPTILIALLKTIAYGWKQFDLNHNANQVLCLSRELVDRVRVLFTHVGTVGKELDKAVHSYNNAVASWQSRGSVTARKLWELSVHGTEPVNLDPVDKVPINLTEDSPSRTFSDHQLGSTIAK